MRMDLSVLERVSLFDSNEKPTRLGDLWADRKVALVFTRHFG